LAEQTPTTDLARLRPSTRTFTIPADEETGSPAQEFVIGKFCFLKSMLLLECLGDLAQRIDVASVFTGSEIRMDHLIEKLPLLMREMRPVVTRALALTLVKNQTFERADRAECDLEAEMAPLRALVSYRLDLEQAAELLTIAVERIGVQDVRQHFPTLLAAIRAS
jgi:hypothetical protein